MLILKQTQKAVKTKQIKLDVEDKDLVKEKFFVPKLISRNRSPKVNDE